MFNPLQILSQLSKAQNPQAIMSQMFQGNPAMERAMEMTNGKSEEEIKQIVMNLSKQVGVDFDGLLNMAKGMGIKL